MITNFKLYEGSWRSIVYDAFMTDSLIALHNYIDTGGDINYKRNGKTLLTNFASQDFNLKTNQNIYKLFKDNGADMNIQDGVGFTAAHIVTYRLFQYVQDGRYGEDKLNGLYLELSILIKIGIVWDIVWDIVDSGGETFLDFLPSDYFERLKRDFPEKYKLFLLKAKANDFNL